MLFKYVPCIIIYMECNGYKITFSCTSHSSKPNQSKISQIFLKRILIHRVSRVKLIVEECLSHLRDDWLDFERLNVIWVCDPEFSFPRRNVSGQMQACWRDEFSMGKNRRIWLLFKGDHFLMGAPEWGLQREAGSLELGASLVPRRNGIWTHPGVAAESGEHFGSCRYSCKAPSAFKLPWQPYTCLDECICNIEG